MFSPALGGQRTPAELIDFYGLARRRVRDLLVDYLCERQAGVDHERCRRWPMRSAGCSGRTWKPTTRVSIRCGSPRRSRPRGNSAWWSDQSRGPTRSTTVPRPVSWFDATGCLFMARMFYRDISRWAGDDPARWGPWLVPCPIRDSDINVTQQAMHTKSRMDQRTRERIPVLPALVAAVTDARRRATELLAVAQATVPGQEFTHDQAAWRRVELRTTSPRVWAIDSASGIRIDLTRAEEVAFWTWAAVEVLRHTGCRIEELQPTELTHHSLVQYRLPDSGELVPLLHIAPSKTDIERLLVISPELADVLAAIVARTRDTCTGAVPDVIAYDRYECRFLPPMPVLFQHLEGLDRLPLSPGQRSPLDPRCLGTRPDHRQRRGTAPFTPHDFRRIFATEAIMNGMPPISPSSSSDIKTSPPRWVNKAVYPDEAITAHRAFIARRRDLRPAEEYRTPTEAEWEEFLGHFQRRKVELGDCGRAYGTACHHEHACIRCALLRVDPARRGRLAEIRDSLLARIDEAPGAWLARRSRGPQGQPRRRQRQNRPSRPAPEPEQRHHRPGHARIPRQHHAYSRPAARAGEATVNYDQTANRPQPSRPSLPPSSTNTTSPAGWPMSWPPWPHDTAPATRWSPEDRDPGKPAWSQTSSAAPSDGTTSTWTATATTTRTPPATETNPGTRTANPRSRSAPGWAAMPPRCSP